MFQIVGNEFGNDSSVFDNRYAVASGVYFRKNMAGKQYRLSASLFFVYKVYEDFLHNGVEPASGFV